MNLVLPRETRGHVSDSVLTEFSTSQRLKMTFKAQSPASPLASDSSISFFGFMAVDLGIPGLSFSSAPLSWALVSLLGFRSRAPVASSFELSKTLPSDPEAKARHGIPGSSGPNRHGGVWARAFSERGVDRIKL